MITVQPVTLERDGISLEPLNSDHESALVSAASDGRLWELWFTTVPFRRPWPLTSPPRLPGNATATCFRGSSATSSATSSSARPATMTSSPRSTASRSGTWYSKSRQRTAVNTTCKLLLLAHAFDTLGCKVVGLRTDNFNFRSQRAIEALGAKKDGVIRHHAMRRDGSVRDSVLYSILADGMAGRAETPGAQGCASRTGLRLADACALGNRSRFAVPGGLRAGPRTRARPGIEVFLANVRRRCAASAWR